MSDEDALLAAIRDLPDEDTPRLAYADWLDEHGVSDAQRARAEFIRVQIEHDNLYHDRDRFAERYNWLDAREKDLRGRYEKEWLAEFTNAPTEKASFSNGFLNLLEFDAKTCVSTARPRWHREPQVTVALRGDGESIRQLCAGWLDGALDLDIRPANEDADPIAEALAASTCVTTLRRLSLWHDGFTDRGLRALAAGAFAELRNLSCFGQFTPDAWAIALVSDACANLTDLTIGHRAPWQTANSNRPGPDLVDAIVAAPVHSRLKFLWLGKSGLGSASVARLCTRGRFDRLEKLWIDNDRVGAAAFFALGHGHFPALTDIDFMGCELTDQAVAPLFRSPLMEQLEKIDFSSNELTAATAATLATCGRTLRLKELNLGFNEIGDAGAVALAASPHFPALEEVHLSGAQVGDAGGDAIGRAPWAKQLKTLYLSYNPISEAKAGELTTRFGSALSIKTA